MYSDFIERSFYEAIRKLIDSETSGRATFSDILWTAFPVVLFLPLPSDMDTLRKSKVLWNLMPTDSGDSYTRESTMIVDLFFELYEGCPVAFISNLNLLIVGVEALAERETLFPRLFAHLISLGVFSSGRER